MAINKPWIPWDPTIDFRKLPGAMGIYEIGNEAGDVLYIGKAGGRSPFGIRGELFRTFASPAEMEDKNWTHPQMGQKWPATDESVHFYRYEVNHQYYGRWVEALLAHHAEFSQLPPGNMRDPEQPPAFINRSGTPAAQTNA